MNQDLKDRVIKVSKSGVCSLNELTYFLPTFPVINYSEPIFRRLKDEVIILSDTDLIDYIKGLHIIEITFRKFKGDEFGFGSPSITHELLNKLNLDNHIKLYDWIAFNGGNFFIPPNITYLQNKRDKQNKLLKEQQKHIEAVVNRKIRKDKQIEVHSRNREENNAIRVAEFNRLNGLTRIEQLREIISSDQHLDYYPKEYSEINKDILIGLNEREKEVLIGKLKRIKENSWWQELKDKISNWVV